MTKITTLLGAAGVAIAMAAPAFAAPVATWTFETSLPATAGPFAPEVGAGSARGFHAGASTYSNPVGNGSAHSFSSNTWAIGDYYQFSTSTIGYNGITLSWDQISSGTGPRDFTLSFSTNGTTFTDFAPYTVLANASPNVWSTGTAIAASSYAFDLSAFTSLNNLAAVYFRLVDTSNVSAAGGVVGTTGTDRVDNFTISGNAVSAVPVPAAVWLFGSGFVALTGIGRRSRRQTS
jgi:hypothetical protein